MRWRDIDLVFSDAEAKAVDAVIEGVLGGRITTPTKRQAVLLEGVQRQLRDGIEQVQRIAAFKANKKAERQKDDHDIHIEE